MGIIQPQISSPLIPIFIFFFKENAFVPVFFIYLFLSFFIFFYLFS